MKVELLMPSENKVLTFNENSGQVNGGRPRIINYKHLHCYVDNYIRIRISKNLAE